MTKFALFLSAVAVVLGVSSVASAEQAPVFGPAGACNSLQPAPACPAKAHKRAANWRRTLQTSILVPLAGGAVMIVDKPKVLSVKAEGKTTLSSVPGDSKGQFTVITIPAGPAPFNPNANVGRRDHY